MLTLKGLKILSTQHLGSCICIGLSISGIFPNVSIAEVSSGGSQTVLITAGWGDPDPIPELSFDVEREDGEALPYGHRGIADPDPIPRLAWRVNRQDVGVCPLNPEGDQNGDGPPDLMISALNGSPVLVWSALVGGAHRIAVAEWAGQSWSTINHLTNGPNDIDPRVFVTATGDTFVTWWTAESSSQVWVTSRQASTMSWSAPIAVSAAGEGGRRPSVVFANDSIYIAYERPSQQPGVSVEVVVARSRYGHPFVPETVFATSQVLPSARVEPQLHSGSDRLWIDWVQAPEYLGYSLLQDSTAWTSTSTQDVGDSTWIGVEMARQRVRWMILAN